ncbi:DUF4192 domain-containing protein [Arthrobacter sp. 35W]|uniref:DUF4192 domain-containing protein n=1 Tax=Arthrobacter sp. 35W TaxID=1132441 RepID=UPI0006888995|nr:DUF4192 domain-containing protein [Arthrobacter sp. 35W]
MERLSIRTPDDFISLMGHSLGYWPTESLVCVTLDGRRIGSTLRVDLPNATTDTTAFVDVVATYITNDREATGVVFGIFSAIPWPPGQDRPFEPVIQQLTEVLSGHNIPVRDGWYIGPSSFTSYLAKDFRTVHPITQLQGSQLNAELVFRGSSIQANSDFRFPVLELHDVSDGVSRHCSAIEAMSPAAATTRARSLWGSLLESTALPTDEEAAELLADFKFVSVRDRLLADIPGIDAPIGELLLAETKRSPQWNRVDRAEELLLHLYTRADGADAAPVLTSLGIIQWWEGKGTRAHQCFHHALEADPDYRLAQLSDRMVSAGIVACWATNKQAAYQPPAARGPQIEGMGMA